MTRRVTPEDHELRAMSEAVLKAAVLHVAYEHGWIVYHGAMILHNRPVRGSSVGYPDLTCARDGEVVFLELKTELGVLEMAQTVWMAALPAYHVIRPKDLASGRVFEILA